MDQGGTTMTSAAIAPRRTSTVSVQRTIVVDTPIDLVFGYVSDFTTTTEWDPGTVRTDKQSGNGGVGTTYRNISRFLGRTVELTYTVEEFVGKQLLRFRAIHNTLTALDTMTFRTTAAGTEVSYTADFSFTGPVRLLTPMLKPAFERLATRAETGMRAALDRLDRTGAPRCTNTRTHALGAPVSPRGRVDEHHHKRGGARADRGCFRLA
jgi:Polyketide cyclase / dehydrase and lipid transport